MVDENEKKKIRSDAERDRRKKMKHLYSTLSSLLPPPQDSSVTKRVSIPATISRAVEYIPELEKRVEGMISERQSLLLKKLSRRRRNCLAHHLTVTPINDELTVVQISAEARCDSSFSEAVMVLEMDGFVVLSASSFASSSGPTLLTLHLKSQLKCDPEKVHEKLKPLFAAC
ncbi:hypothetical protein M569_00579 [Genlisea aurea]|uniref:BHLH domain-containing protein n=1 Tax=Genlisea aurea TaxID=192259 RepID=S8EDX0_9LAMI|nr:hypothetical protein M569_00579 [Genlisea aurea]